MRGSGVEVVRGSGGGGGGDGVVVYGSMFKLFLHSSCLDRSCLDG